MLALAEGQPAYSRGARSIWSLESASEHILVTLSKSPGTMLLDAYDHKLRLRELLVELDTARSLRRGAS